MGAAGRDPGPVVRRCWPRSASTPPGAEGRALSNTAARTAGTCCSSRTAAALHLQLPRRGGAEAVVAGARFRWASTSSACAFTRTGTVEGSHTPLGDATLYIDDAEVASRRRIEDPSGNVRPGRRQRSASGATPDRRCRAACKAPFPFTGGTIAQVNVDVSGKPYVDLERELAPGLREGLMKRIGCDGAGRWHA